MGCKCQSNPEPSEIVASDINLETTKTLQPPLLSRISPIRLVDEKEDCLTLTKETFYTDPNKNNKINDIDKSFLCHSLLDEINQARQSPLSYIEKIEKYKQFIYINNKGVYFAANKHTSISLKNGHKAFDDCITFLRSQTPMEPLKLLDILSLPFATEGNNGIFSYDYLSQAITQKKKECQGRYIIDNFHYDQNICIPEISALIQIIDDTGSKYRRRKNIFNQESTVIGINCQKINATTVCYYIIFGHDNKKVSSSKK